MRSFLFLFLPACVDLADVQIDAMGDYACLLADGAVSCWHQSGDVGTEPAPIDHLTAAVAVRADAGGACAVHDDGRATCWSATDGVAADVGLAGVVDLVGAPDPSWPSSATCAVTTDGAVLCRGDNRHGQLGDGGKAPRDTFARVVGIDSAVRIDRAVGAAFCATLESGDVRCWGAGALGSLGDGILDEHDQPSPVEVPVSGVRSVHGGLASTCALGDDGGVSCWGWRTGGQLGDSRVCESDAEDCVAAEPVVVAGLSQAEALDSGWAGSCALDAAGDAVCWGGLGQPGSGAPRARGLQRPVVDVAVGLDFACFTDAGGQVECVGA